MVVSPAVLALCLVSGVVASLTAAGAGAGATVAVGWDPESDDRRQLARERRAFLVESIVTLVLPWQLLALFLFVATAERLHPLFDGAMCAVGTLEASTWGMPALLSKVLAFGLAGLWLVAHHATRGASGRRLVRVEHLALLPLALVLVADIALQLAFFVDLDPRIVTSCCATVFATDANGIAGRLAALPPGATRLAFFAVLAPTLASGWWAVARRRSPAIFAGLVILFGAVAGASTVSWIAPAFYQLPEHHCPLCLLASDHGYVGYPLYAALGVGLVAGTGAGLVRGLRSLDRGSGADEAAETRLCLVSLVGIAVFALLSVGPFLASGLRLEAF